MNDVVVFLILAGVALLVRWLGNARDSQGADSEQKAAPNDKPRPQPPPRAPAESEQEKVRRFLEALGVPQGSAPPPPVQPRPPVRQVLPAKPQRAPKVKRSFVQPLPPVVTVPEPLEPTPVEIPAPVWAELAAPTSSAPPLAPIVRLAPRALAPRAAVPLPALSLGDMLRSPGSARQAIVLREVLGAPRGLEPLASDRF